MIRRDNQIVDIQILIDIVCDNFFASTSILVLSGLIIVLGVTDSAIDFVRDLSFSASVSREFG